jgi:hypothetical protein
MVSLPFLNFHHSYPLPTFYTEWIAFALGGVALFALALDEPKGPARVPYLSLGLLGLVLVLLIQVAAGRVEYSERNLLGMLYLIWAALLVWLGAHLRERCGLERFALAAQTFVALGGFLVALSGFALYFGIDVLGFRLIGARVQGMMSAHRAAPTSCQLPSALVSVVSPDGRRRHSAARWSRRP